ncbi:uncharacterized protein TOT_010000682 [Theileria orientalis strain Shintoku]|uniref:Trafficking protein particle complex subunit n=1 Tax=Theileria orientalis strain Shintoku TaxID=869250 RepID=J4CCD9_THEOR|nr:uncharacterized protein TOT_010000682 [Theileria orientalis strain Shintoku]BAM39222.1 uncharacterized protein TOT_010000682 [Theileria orientalis strain Shintoku]|eukprot:XP_009689523.1 uncharacterized protein TOT_010000682 [Theileria orientalis strain Shintoku]
MSELHSFYIFFKTKSIYRSLYTEAAKRAVTNCISHGFKDNRSDQYNQESSFEATSSFENSHLLGLKDHQDSNLELYDLHDLNASLLSKAQGRKSSISDDSLPDDLIAKSTVNLYDSIDENLHKNYEKLLLGFLTGLTSFSKTICETNDLRDPEGLSVAHFNVCSTHQFKIHYFETITGYKLVCLTSCDFPNLEETLKSIYVDLLNNLVLANPTYVVGSCITSSEFELIVRRTILSSI